MATYPNISVERWSGDLDSYDDITEFVTNVSWMHSTSAPWGSINATMFIPRRLWLSRMPCIGEWLVVRDLGTGKALQWGYITERNTGIAASGQGHIGTKQTYISAISWLDLLGKVSVFAYPGLTERIGTVMPSSDWTGGSWRALLEIVSDRFTSVPKQLLFGDKRSIPGRALAMFMSSLDLPHTALGKSQAQAPVGYKYGFEGLHLATRVAYNEDTAISYAPLRRIDAVPGYKLDAGLFALAAIVRDTSVLDIVMQSFYADPNLVELFPSLEDPGLVEISGDARDSALQREIATISRLSRSNFSEDFQSQIGLGATLGDVDEITSAALYATDRYNRIEGALNERAKPALLKQASEQGRKFQSTTAARLGQNPVLIYRMRPWRVLSVSDMLGYAFEKDRREKKRGREGWLLKLVNDLVADKSQYDLETFNGTTWNVREATEIDPSDVVDVSFDASDDRHVNMVTVGLPFMPDSPVGFLSRLGLPFIQRESINRRGARMYRPQWPFMPPSARVDSDLLSFMRSVAMMAVQHMLLGDRFENGTISCARYQPSVRHGEMVRMELPFGSPPGAKAGSGTTTGEKPTSLIAYAEQVAHTVDVNAQGAISANTSINYSRGLFDERERGAPHTFNCIGGQSARRNA